MGASGYIAQRHIEAISDIGGDLIAICDPVDSVGIIDRYFDDVKYFRTIEELDKYLDDKIVDFFVVCTPNYLHFSHIAYGLRLGADVICEKPLVIDMNDFDRLLDIEEESSGKIYPILQARCHPKILELKNTISRNDDLNVKVWYITKRTDWYDKSWKGDKDKSGGALLNIGIHFLDVLYFLFGHFETPAKINYITQRKASGVFKFGNVNVEWIFSLNKKDMPEGFKGNVLRMIEIGNTKIEFSDGFSDLHKHIYEKILDDDWFRISDIRESLDTAKKITECYLWGKK